jgi:octanoyl-[GcvH]:protein N-octanoyltransferase
VSTNAPPFDSAGACERASERVPERVSERVPERIRAGSGPRPLRLHHDRYPGKPLLDTSMSHAMLRRVASGAVGESLRIYIPENTLLFSSLDARRPGYRRALELAEQAGFPPIIRLAGGQAAAFLEQSIAFAWATPDFDAHLHIRPRFEELANWIASALRRLGLDARVGSIPGEYCPGEFSVNLGGRVKVMGVGQRVIRGGAHVGGVLTVGQSELLRQTLTPIYEVLGLEFRSESAGGVADFDESLDCETVMTAMVETLRQSGYVLENHHFDDALEREAEKLYPIHRPTTSAQDRKGIGALLRATSHDGKTLVQDETRK